MKNKKFTYDGRSRPSNDTYKKEFNRIFNPTNSTNAITETTTQAYVRGRARQMVLRFESDDDASADGNLDIGWRLGATRIDTRPDGKR